MTCAGRSSLGRTKCRRLPFSPTLFFLTPNPVPEEREQPQDQELLIAIVLLLLAGLSAPNFTERLSLLLAPFGVPPTAVVALVALLQAERGLSFQMPEQKPGALNSMRRGVVGRRAMYILAAVRRLGRGGSAKAERTLFKAHLAAEKRRYEAARAVDAAAAKWGPVLGWWSERDDRTTPACFAAHGANFSALRPPAIGWPGTIHAGQCRCKPVAPWPGGDMLEGSGIAVEDRLLTPLEA